VAALSAHDHPVNSLKVNLAQVLQKGLDGQEAPRWTLENR